MPNCAATDKIGVPPVVDTFGGTAPADSRDCKHWKRRKEENRGEQRRTEEKRGEKRRKEERGRCIELKVKL